jgi:hypothetical protein
MKTPAVIIGQGEYAEPFCVSEIKKPVGLVLWIRRLVDWIGGF